jgi:hypothetical protein
MSGIITKEGGSQQAIHEYQKRLLLFSTKHPDLLLEGTFGQITIAHDDYCDVYSGAVCNCDPEITHRCNGVSHRILSDGSAVEAN